MLAAYLRHPFFIRSTRRHLSSLSVQSLDHVCITCSDVAASIQWYQNILNLQQKHLKEEHFYPTCPHSPAFLSPGLAIYQLSSTTTPITNHNGAHFALKVNAETFAHAKNGGLSSLLLQHNPSTTTPSTSSIAVEYQDYGIQKSLFFYDPDHNMIELTLWEKEQTTSDLHSLEELSFSSLNNTLLKIMTPSSPLYTSSYSDSPFHELPWFGFLWPGGNAIAKHILTHPKTIQNKNVLDFACGCGLSSILSLQLGASSVIANDISMLCLEATRLNINLNGIDVKLQNERMHYLKDDIIGCLELEIDVVLAGK
jgi:catechol 2,3-dioxygenase-like lactoylglutathione lyase family enzyme